ncbi:VOC family protein [Paenibacillus fonticola]|uniref:VOC family protein n=1 Tax=Paenibacillus fonticola TaxID=379896 RepID=UPI000381DEAE|nr:VOC family protein [Paenibacillus fonticola]
MEKGILGTKVVAQVGLIVKDIEVTGKKYADFLGVEVPPIELTDEFEKSQIHYRNNPTTARAKLMFFRTPGSVEIELIEPDHNPSTWREFLDTHGEGVHHLAFYIEDSKGKIAKLQELGMNLVQTGEYTGGRYSYIDSSDDLKVMLELLEND